jgi:hypothetical protein
MAEELSPKRRGAPVTLPSVSSASSAGSRFKSESFTPAICINRRA